MPPRHSINQETYHAKMYQGSLQEFWVQGGTKKIELVTGKTKLK